MAVIDIRRLEILRELDRCGTITATAAAVNLTPSAVSQQLAALSREAGVAMLEPDGRRVQLTAAARLLLTHAHEVFTHLEHAESDLAAFRRGGAGTVRVGAFPSAICSIAVWLLEEMAETGLTVQIREVEPEDAVGALLGRTVDVAVTLTDGPLALGEQDPRLATVRLADDVMDAVLPVGHPLAPADPDAPGAPIELAALAGERWIMSLPGSQCWHTESAACTAAGFTPRVGHHCDEFSGLVSMIAATGGVGLLPRLARPSLPPVPVRIVPIADPAPFRRIGVQFRAGTARQPHIAPVLAGLRRIARRIGPVVEPVGPAGRRSPRNTVAVG